MIKFQLKGASQMSANIKNVAEKFPDDVAAAAYQEAQIEVTEMKRRTPVDTRPNRFYPYATAPHPGRLRNSIHAEQPERKGKTISVTIATGKEAPYAVYVHEDPDAFHFVGEWKFMESVLKESRSHMAERIGRRVHFGKRRGR